MHFVTVPALARILCERNGIAAPEHRPDPLEERALLARCVDAGAGPVRSYARRFPSALRALSGALRASEARAENAMTELTDRWRRDSDRSVVELFRVLDARRRSDMAIVRDRLDQVAMNDEARGRENSLILAAPTGYFVLLLIKS